jgi:hypothetical protein
VKGFNEVLCMVKVTRMIGRETASSPTLAGGHFRISLIGNRSTMLQIEIALHCQINTIWMHVVACKSQLWLHRDMAYFQLDWDRLKNEGLNVIIDSRQPRGYDRVRVRRTPGICRIGEQRPTRKQ